MISSDLLEKMRCPLDPTVRLSLEGDRLVCTRCGVKYRVQDRLPKMIVEEAELPAGVASIDQLPCQCAKRGTAPAT